MVICPDCGKEVPKDKFCKNCGAYLGNIQEIPKTTETLPEVSVVNGDAPARNIKYCTNCGCRLGDDFKFCPNCGYNLNSPVKTQNITLKKEKSMLIAVILSVFLPGLGQIYLGLDNKGALLLIAYVVSAILILLLIGFILVIVIWIWALVDTKISMNALNRGEEVEDKLF